jgi:hypothetical protein
MSLGTLFKALKQSAAASQSPHGKPAKHRQGFRIFFHYVLDHHVLGYHILTSLIIYKLLNLSLFNTILDLEFY